MATASSFAANQRAALVRRGQLLEYLTLGSCTVEAVVSIGAGLVAGSIALMGFGIDSVIEVTSGAALLWRLRHDADVGRRKVTETRALRIVGYCFAALAAYVLWGSVSALIHHEIPRSSLPGVCIAVFSLVTMNMLARAKRRVAQGLSSAALRADAKQSELCSYLSAILLGGLVVNASLGWWWADAVAGLLMVPIIAKEAFDAFQGKSCGCTGGCP